MKEDIQAKFKAVQTPQPNIGIEGQNNLANLVANDEGLNSSINTDELTKFRTSSETRESLYQIFDEMSGDPIISGALELYAEDSAEYNEQGNVVWATSDDEAVSKICNNILQDLKIDEKAWEHIYSLCKYGDLYLETFRATDNIEKQQGKSNLLKNTSIIQEGKNFNSDDTELVESVIVNIYGKQEKLQNYIEAVKDPAQIFDLTQRGKSVGFLKVPKYNKNNSNTLGSANYEYNYITDDVFLYDPTKYVHICLANPSDRNPETVELFKYTNSDKNKTETERIKERESLTYTVKRGKSILQDVYKTYKELSLLTDSLLLNRVVRSALVRIIQVEVGEMGKSETMQLLQRIKSLFEQKTAMTAGEKMREYNSPSPLENNVYIPTRGGQGALSVSNLGGDVNVKDIADIDYYNNKLFAGLKIPKQFLGYTDDTTGFSGGESLTKISGRYAKTIKRIQNTYCQGIKTLLNIFLIDRGLIQYVNKFQVKMLAPTTLDVTDRIESLKSKTEVIESIMNLLSNVENTKDQLSILQSLFNSFIDIPEVNEKLDTIVKSMPDEVETETPTEDMNEPFGGSSSEPSFEENEPTESSTSEESSNAEESEELPSPEDLDIDLSDNEELA
jgi:hypothetical protein